jgi:hypothetical protein
MGELLRDFRFLCFGGVVKYRKKPRLGRHRSEMLFHKRPVRIVRDHQVVLCRRHGRCERRYVRECDGSVARLLQERFELLETLRRGGRLVNENRSRIHGGVSLGACAAAGTQEFVTTGRQVRNRESRGENREEEKVSAHVPLLKRNAAKVRPWRRSVKALAMFVLWGFYWKGRVGRAPEAPPETLGRRPEPVNEVQVTSHVHQRREHCSAVGTQAESLHGVVDRQ